MDIVFSIVFISFPSLRICSETTRLVENVVITTKGLQDRNLRILDGTTVENKGKTIN